MKLTLKNSIIDLSDEDVKELKRQLDGKEKSIWELETGDIHFWLENGYKIRKDMWGEDVYDTSYRNSGNIFLTQASAEKELSIRKAIVRVKKWVWQNDAEIECNINNRVWVMYWDFEDNKFVPLPDKRIKSYTTFGYIKSEELCDKLIKECEAELRIIFDV